MNCFGRYTIRIQLLDGDKVVKQDDHQVAGDEAVWNKYQALNKQFMYESVITEEDQMLYENIVNIFGNLGQKLKDYYLCKQKPELQQQYGDIIKCPDMNELMTSFKVWVQQAVNDPQLKRVAVAVDSIKKQSNTPEEFLANVKAEFMHGYKKYAIGESYIEERLITKKERERINAIHTSEKEKKYTVELKYNKATHRIPDISATKPLIAIKKAIDMEAGTYSHLPVETIIATAEIVAW